MGDRSTIEWTDATWKRTKETQSSGQSGTGNDFGASDPRNQVPQMEARAELSWVIVGGESGRGARPMHPQWPRALRDQCCYAGVKFFFKQHGEFIGSADLCDLPDGDYDGCQYDRTHDSIRVGKRAAGRLLDGVEHNAAPRRAAP